MATRREISRPDVTPAPQDSQTGPLGGLTDIFSGGGLSGSLGGISEWFGSVDARLNHLKSARKALKEKVGENLAANAYLDVRGGFEKDLDDWVSLGAIDDSIRARCLQEFDQRWGKENREKVTPETLATLLKKVDTLADKVIAEHPKVQEAIEAAERGESPSKWRAVLEKILGVEGTAIVLGWLGLGQTEEEKADEKARREAEAKKRTAAGTTPSAPSAPTPPPTAPVPAPVPTSPEAPVRQVLEGAGFVASRETVNRTVAELRGIAKTSLRNPNSGLQEVLTKAQNGELVGYAEVLVTLGGADKNRPAADIIADLYDIKTHLPRGAKMKIIMIPKNANMPEDVRTQVNKWIKDDKNRGTIEGYFELDDEVR